MQDLQTIKILIADGHAVVGSGVAKVLGGIKGFQVLGQAKSGEETFYLFEHHTPDIVTIDIDLPGAVSGLEVIRMLRNRYPALQIVVLTNLLEEMIIRDALRAGAISYLLKNVSAEELVHAIQAAYQRVPTLSLEVTRILIREVTSSNGHHLTDREQQVLQLIAEGWSNHEIAKQLSVSLSTVQFHVSNILHKLGVHNRIEAATFAVRHKLARQVSDD
jgi:NarL family two-component system response regulator LiaR